MLNFQEFQAILNSNKRYYRWQMLLPEKENIVRVKQNINLNDKQTLWQGCTKILCYKMHSKFSIYFPWQR